MKRLKIAVIVTAAMLLMAGCGDSERVISGDENQSSGGTVTGEGSAASAAAKGYTFVSQGVTVGIDMDAAPIVEGLGEPVSYYEAASCAFEGLDKIFTYSSFVIETYPDNEKDLVSRVILMDDSVSTPEGVIIGDTRARVEEVYGTEGAEESGRVVYSKDGMKLCFIFNEEDDSVISIEYMTTVLD